VLVIIFLESILDLRNPLWQTSVFNFLSTTNVPPENWEEVVVLSADIPKRDEVVEAFKVCVLYCC